VGRFPRHFVPGYDRLVPPGQDVLLGGIRILLLVALANRAGSFAPQIVLVLVLVLEL
jgi:hypothetical protein